MKLVNTLCAGALLLGLAGCSNSTTAAASSAAASSTADSSASSTTVEEASYTETFDADKADYKEETFHNMTYDMVKGWSPRKMSKDDGLTYLISGQKDSIEVHFVEGGNTVDDMKAFLGSDDMKEYCNSVTDSEEQEIAGLKGVHANTVTTIATTIMVDANKEIYMVPDKDGFYFMSFTYDPTGTTDYSAAFEHIVNSIKIA